GETGLGGIHRGAVLHADGDGAQVALAEETAHHGRIGGVNVELVGVEAGARGGGDADDARGHLAHEQDLADGGFTAREECVASVGVDDDFLGVGRDRVGREERSGNELHSADAEELVAHAVDLRGAFDIAAAQGGGGVGGGGDAVDIGLFGNGVCI